MTRIPQIQRELSLLLREQTGRPRSIWMHDQHIKVYARRAVKSLGPGELAWGAVLSTVDVDEQYQQRGLLGEIVDYIEWLVKDISDLQFVLLECVNNEHLIPYYKRRGYLPRDPHLELGGDYIKLRSQLI